MSPLIFGQVEINPGVIFLESSGDVVRVRPEVYNNTLEFKNIYWKFEKGENFPEDWAVSIWDSNLCYMLDEYQSNVLLPNMMDPGDTFDFTVSAYPNGKAGSGYIILRLFDDSNFENEVFSTHPPTTSTDNNLLKKVELYPNPTSDYFGITGDENVTSLEIINSMGQTIKNVIHETEELHSISFLSDGLYYVILRDENQDVIKVISLSKR